jgi:hypothetical protein
MATDKMVYYFGKTKTEGKGLSKGLLGGKGVNLAEMTSIGLPVPPGFTITTECCDSYYKSGKKLPAGLMDQVHAAVKMLEKELGKKFGDNENPLLFSVRSGAAASMPGMMNTILNLGLNDAATEGLAKATRNERFAYDAYRRLIGLNLIRGFRRAVQQRLGGTQGCTHLTELAAVLPTAAIQAFAGEIYRPRDQAHEPEATDHQETERRPFQLDRCRALRLDGPAVAKYYPRWYTGNRTQEITEGQGI